LNATLDEVDGKLRNFNLPYLCDIFIPPPHITRSKKFAAKKQFHAKCFSYSLMSFLHDRNKPHKSQQAELSDTQVNTWV